jgi:hypothetical protein
MFAFGVEAPLALFVTLKCMPLLIVSYHLWIFLPVELLDFNYQCDKIALIFPYNPLQEVLKLQWDGL